MSKNITPGIAFLCSPGAVCKKLAQNVLAAEIFE
jgi:hypothetical protein